ncbi:MAG: hypothetical protein IJ079_07345 [Lachnospiraceae bacterium]|nr:hypothetical protein [Lachnospiraceae bacterium]
MNPWIIFGIVSGILIIAMVVLYFVGQKLQKKQLAQQEQIEAAAQPVTMMVIDKKIMKLKDAKLPKVVMEQTPKRYHNSKMPIVKAKAGPQILTLIADNAVYDQIPNRGEIKAMVSGIYIVGVKTVRGKVEPQDEKKKKGIGAKLRQKQVEYQKMMKEEEAAKAMEKENKAKEKARRETAKKITK